MRRASAFNELVDATEKLTLEEKEALLEVLHGRTVEERRERLRNEIARAREEHKVGKIRPVTVRHIIGELGK